MVMTSQNSFQNLPSFIRIKDSFPPPSPLPQYLSPLWSLHISSVYQAVSW